MVSERTIVFIVFVIYPLSHHVSSLTAVAVMCSPKGDHSFCTVTLCCLIRLKSIVNFYGECYFQIDFEDINCNRLIQQD